MAAPPAKSRRADKSRPRTYARLSTDKQRDASIEDQIRNCRNYAHRQEWLKARQKRQSAEKGERVKMGLRAAEADATGRSTGRGPKYLFSGLLKCGCCGANYIMHSTTSYGCALNINGGDAACSNRLRLPRKLAEMRLLDALKQDLFTPKASE